jgi:hypothetical protein
MPLILAMSAYDVGSLAGVATLAALLVALIVRVRRSAPAPLAAANASALAPMALPVRAPRRVSDIAAICVVGVLLAGGVLNLADRRDAAGDPWSTAEGRNMSAGFVDGCTRSTRGLIDCGCLLDALRATPAYDTPERFAALGRELTDSGGDPKRLPQAYLAAVQSCRT